MLILDQRAARALRTCRRRDADLSDHAARARRPGRMRSAYAVRGGWCSPLPIRLRAFRWPSYPGQRCRDRHVRSLYVLGPIGVLP